MESNKLSRAAEPLDLPLSRQPARPTVSSDLVRRQRSAEAAIALACQASGLDAKEIHMSLELDSGHWSRIVTGSAHFPLNKIAEFCSVVGNTVLPEWIAYQVGCGLVVLKSEAERRAEAAEQALVEAQRENALLRDLVQGRAVRG